MKPEELNVAVDSSNYFVSAPSAIAMDSFLYPTYLGRFTYLPGYYLHRLRFDSFLLMFIMEGTLTLEYNSQKQIAKKNSFVMLDCYREHTYYSDTGCEALWIHFDGFCAQKYYQMITDKLGDVFSLSSPAPILNRMNHVYQTYAEMKNVSEPLISKCLYDILIELIVYTPRQVKTQQKLSAVENCKIYIQNNLDKDLRVEDLAKRAYMSTYYFIRVFKNETGMSPHEYVVHSRIHLAKILLLESNIPISEVCYRSGFSSDSVFCAAFKKNVGMSPTAYRKKGLPQI